MSAVNTALLTYEVPQSDYFMLPADIGVLPERGDDVSSDGDTMPNSSNGLPSDIPLSGTVALPLDGDHEGGDVSPPASEEKLLKDLCTQGHEKLVILLRPACALGNDYRLLAAKMGYTNEEIKCLESLREPVKELMTRYDKEGRTIAELLSLLQQIDRPDVVQDLQPYIGRVTSFFKKGMKLLWRTSFAFDAIATH